MSTSDNALSIEGKAIISQAATAAREFQERAERAIGEKANRADVDYLDRRTSSSSQPVTEDLPPFHSSGLVAWRACVDATATAL